MSHGGNIHEIAGRLGIAPDALIDMSASINPLGPSQKAISAIKNSLALSAYYPDPEAREMTQAIAAHYKVDPTNILCGNGSTELIFLLMRALAPKTVLLAEPTFSEYAHAAKVAGAKIKTVVAKRSDGYMPDLDALASAMPHVDIAFLCNPGNPTGRLIGRDEILKLIKSAHRHKCLLVVDEAFMDFCAHGSVIDLNNPYLIVLRSLTKFYALAGLRAGFGVFPTRIIRKLREHKEPWSCNTLAQKAAVAGLEDLAYRARTLRSIQAGRDFLEREFGRLGIRHYPSDANYFLLELDSAQSIIHELANRRIIVRDCSNFRGLDRRHIRIAIRSRKENTLLITALEQAMGREDYECRSS